MKKVIIFQILLLTLPVAIFSADYYQIKTKQGEPDAVGISPADKKPDEFIVAILEIGPRDQEWWIISERSKKQDDGSFVFKNGLDGYDVIMNTDNTVLVIYKEYDLKYIMEKVDKIVYKGFEVELPTELILLGIK